MPTERHARCFYFSQPETCLLSQDSFEPVSRLVQDKHDTSQIKVYHYHNNHLGIPQELTDECGNVVWCNYEFAWGGSYQDYYKEQSLNNTPIDKDHLQPLKFQGQFFDTETSLHYNRFRYYDSDVGMFISRDPIGLLGGNNIFQYADNPVMWIDPFGLKRGSESFPKWMKTKQGYERHHIIPYEHRNHELFRITGMNVNNATNMVYLPVKECIHPTKAVHYEFKLNGKPHSEYNKDVGAQLDNLLRQSKRGKWSVERTRKELLNLQHRLRHTLNNARLDTNKGCI